MGDKALIGAQSPLVGHYDVNGYFYLPGASQVDGAPEELLDYIHAHWHTFPPQNQMWNGLMAFFYVILWFINAVGNFAVIWVFFRTKSLQSPANIFIVNLALADFFMMMTQAPFYIINVFRSRWWSYGVLGCDIYGFTGAILGIAAIMTMVMIGVDRFLVITQGIGGTRISIPIAIFMVVLVWVYAGAVTIPPLIKVWGRYAPEGMLTTCSIDYLGDEWSNKAYCLFIFCFAYVLPLLTLIFCYSKIVSAVWTHEKALKDQAKKMNVESLRSNQDAKDASVEMKIAKAALASVLLWVAIWTPYAIVVMMGAFGDRSLVTPLVSMLPSLFAKCASCANPVVFAISHPKFKIALKKEFPSFYCASGEKDNVSQASSRATVKS